jgi:fatty-acyl-CoA synthase
VSPAPPSALSLVARIEQVAAADLGTVTFVTGDEHQTVGWDTLHAQARTVAARLQALGVVPGDHVALLGPTTRNLVAAVQGVWLAGAVLVTLPLPMRMASLERFVAQTRQRLAQSDSRLVLVDPELAALVAPEPGGPPFVELDVLCGDDGVGADDWQRPADDPDALALLQFTSGSTSEPKGVMLRHRNICHNLDGAWAAASMTPDDTVVSWLPLYHDMGLIGLLCVPMTGGCSLVQGAPQDFLARPLRWFRWLSEFGGTVTAGPNFSYALGARALRRAEEPLDLSKVEVLLSGAEPVDAEVFRNFLDAAARYGLDPASAFPAFGMAEVCIAGTFPPRGRGLRTDVVDRQALEVEQRAVAVEPGTAGAVELAVLGGPVDGLELRVVDVATGELCGERQVGELHLAGNALTAGYYGRPEDTAELLVDGWLHTGDLAYLLGGELVVCGRIKNVMIVGGRNLYPQDVEKAVGEVDGVRAGNVVAFGVDGRHGAQHVVVVAEATAPSDDAEAGEWVAALQRVVVGAVTESVGVPPWEVVLVAPGTVPKTSSGKLQRSACRAQFVDGSLARLAEGG